MIIGQGELLDELKHLVNENTKEITLCSAFIKKTVLEELAHSFYGVHVKVYVRWDLFDLVRGASDIEIYDVCKEYGWDLYRNRKLHAKFVLVDNKHLILGSSNYTLSGTNRGKKNIERNIVTTISSEGIKALMQDLLLSKKITEELYEEVKQQAEQYSDLQLELESITKEVDKFEETMASDYTFSLEDLPPFRPILKLINMENEGHLTFLRKNNVETIHDLQPIKEFVFDNPISNLIFSKLHRDEPILRWGTIERLIRNDSFLYGLASNDLVTLQQALSADLRLFNLLCWIEYFEPSHFEVCHRKEYLEDPRKGTCSINLREFSECPHRRENEL